MSKKEVPSTTSLSDIYTEDALEGQSRRWEALREAFVSQYHTQPEYVSRSPGRVNLIGEHIDYSLYDVLPMSVAADVLVAFATTANSAHFEIANIEGGKYPQRKFGIGDDGDVDIDASSLEWSNYFKAGLRASLQLLKKNDKHELPVGMQIMVDGSVPAGGGLSSSAAFVCASALAVLKANGEHEIDKTELCDLAIVSERAVGVNSGGMDQAASVFSLRDNATYVSFLPRLEATPIRFPKSDLEYCFVIAQSFVTADKHTSGQTGYNLRVVECTLAATMLAKIFAIQEPLPKDNSPLGTSLRGFQSAYFNESDDVEPRDEAESDRFLKQLKRLVSMAEDYLPQKEGYTREQIADVLKMSVQELNDKFMSSFLVKAERFKLRQRALHVFQEARRVLEFRKLLSTTPKDGSTLIQDLGALMNETQDSCRELYECSCPELDELCQVARDAGASGSRLTGAGWGGCSVHLVRNDKVEEVKNAWIERYYRKKWPDMDGARLREAIVVSKPGSGSYLYRVRHDSIE